MGRPEPQNPCRESTIRASTRKIAHLAGARSRCKIMHPAGYRYGVLRQLNG